MTDGNPSRRSFFYLPSRRDIRYALAMHWFFLGLIGLIGGLLSGMFGIGGGIVMVPCLVLLVGLSQHQAQGTSLAVLAIPVAALGAWKYYQAGHVDLTNVAIIALAFLLGIFGGSSISLSLDPAVVKKGFAILLLGVAIYMWFSSTPSKTVTKAATESQTATST